MATLSEILMQQHEGMFKMLDGGLSSIPDKPVSDYPPEQLTALRLILHSLEAIDNYWSSNTPPNYGEFLPHGVRSTNDSADLPSHADIKGYLAEAKGRSEAYLASLSDENFLSKDNTWDWELLNLFFYVTNHTFAHLGHLDQLLYEKGDPRGWRCWTYEYDEK